ncbi:MAG: VOC family protein [Pseudomonadales bacterium]|nr:VOC family protein [Pseudomonadales bacterium]NRA16632.1 VOC family protein [Oceanospirillaceae bacterium]
MKPRLTHIALHVEELEACVQFYQQYCQLQVIHRRQSRRTEVIWMAEQDLEHEFVLVLLKGGKQQQPRADDFSHLGFAVESINAVDAIAEKAQQQGQLVWPAVQENFPVGYYCGLIDPNGNYVEFSYGQPLGPGAEKM